MAVTRCHDSTYHMLSFPYYPWQVGQPGFAYPVYDYDSLIILPSNVTHNNINYTVTSIDKEAFLFQKNMKTVVLPSTVVTIDSGAFNCSALTDVEMPNVRYIGFAAFIGTALSEIVLPPSLEEIGAQAFAGLPIQELEFPSGLRKLKYHAFFDCPLRRVTFQEGVEEIETNALDFQYMDSITFPSTLEKIGCLGELGQLQSGVEYPLKYLEFKDGGNPLTIEAGFVANFRQLKTVKLSNRIVELGEGSFHGTGIETLSIPPQVRNIPNGCFYNCPFLRHVTFPEELDTIGEYAFGNCTSLGSLTLHCVVPPVVFGSSFTRNDIQVTIPCHSEENYLSDSEWSGYTSFSYHEDCTGIGNSQKQTIKAYPIPFQNVLMVECDAATTSKIEIMDVLGQLQYVGVPSDDKLVINTSFFPSGVYILTITSIHEEKSQIKMLKK